MTNEKRIRKFMYSNDIVYCLECGKSFKQIHWAHLAKHNLSTREYMHKHNLNKTMLCSKSSLVKRQEMAIKAHLPGGYLNGVEKHLIIQKGGAGLDKARKAIKKFGIGSIVSKRLSENVSHEEHLRRGKILASNLTKEDRIKIGKRFSKSNKGKPSWNKGKTMPPLSEEMKRRISETLKGRPNTWGHKISKSLKKHFVDKKKVGANEILPPV